MEHKDLLGGKGANLAEMSSVLGLPVPPGFTISTDACREYMHGGWPKSLSEEISQSLTALEKGMGRKLGDPNDPLLVSVRSGAKFSMPGMMDTILNLGLNDESVKGLAAVTSNERFAYDSYRRFISMYGRIVLGVEGKHFEEPLEEMKHETNSLTDANIPADALKRLCETYQQVILTEAGEPFPQDPAQQIRGSVEAVFRSWNGPRAIAYRVREKISHDLGTAVNIQVMVFGNRDDNSGTGVGFTRNAATGDAHPYGDFLVNAQGEDVVAGIRNTENLDALQHKFPEIHKELLEIFSRLELHYKDMCDTEFTIEQGKLWMLQTRIGKRTGAAALKMAVDMTKPTGSGKSSWQISRPEAIMRVSPEHLEQVLHPQLVNKHEVLTTGLAASPGAAVGRVYFSADDAESAVRDGHDVILVRSETSPEDVHGMMIAKGVLTSRGGLVSHAAVVARGWGTPAIVGAESVKIVGNSFTVGDVVVHEGDWISLDGTTGEVMLGKVELKASEPPSEFVTLLQWADDIRRGRMSVRANADTSEDARKARELGAEGIGLCRTEHMFLAADRLPIVRRMILALTPEEEEDALQELRIAQKADFFALLKEMSGLPVTIRLLDPPLHEFLPDIKELEIKHAQEGLSPEEESLLSAAHEWSEVNPMLGTRGVRLGVMKPGLYAMQVRALMEASDELSALGYEPIVEVMIPLTVTREELALARSWVDAVLTEFNSLSGANAPKGDASVKRPMVSIGTMVETPRAALRADELAEIADFFSFGTNDLTQMTFGFSRDDVESKMMPEYLSAGLLQHNPFETIDQTGVGELVQLAVQRGRATKKKLKIGVCGEHGGDPESIGFFYKAGLDYVSCSPYRVPIARLSVAQAIIGVPSSESK